MPLPVGCPPNWEYKDHPQFAERIVANSRQLYRECAGGTHELPDCAMDSRAAHRTLFRDLTPGDCEYFAGHYRGEEFRCLKKYDVGIGADSQVGVPCWAVHSRITDYAINVSAVLQALDNDPNQETTEFVQRLVAATASIFTDLLTIHPYANGNGHVARWISIMILRRFGFKASPWKVEPGPGTDEYNRAIYEHRRQNPQRLEAMILRSLLS